MSRYCFRIVLSVELFRWLEKKGYAFLLTVCLGAYPMLAELLLGIGDKSLAGICDIDDILSFTVLLYFIDNNKVILIPMDDAR